MPADDDLMPAQDGAGPEEQQLPKLPPRIKQSKLNAILRALKERPCKRSELEQASGLGTDLTLGHIQYLLDQGQIEMLPSTHYYSLTGEHRYDVDLENASIDKIPEPFFFEIPIIKKWFQRSADNPTKMKYLTTFRSVCYGRVVPTFKINPSKWVHDATTEDLYLKFKEHHKKGMGKHIQKAVKAFLSNCLRVTLTKTDADYLGLKVDTKEDGKYRFLKLTDEQMQAAETWLETTGAEVAKKYKVIPEEILAHYAFSTEAFPRPSRVLTIEVQSVHKYPSHDGKGVILHYLQYESKQHRPWPKFVMDKKLVGWADYWLERRRYFGSKFLFLNNDKHIPRKFDSDELRTDRARYAAIYKEMFKAIGVTDEYFLNDTLYGLRHIGIQKWLRRLGPKGIIIIAQMGWEDIDTLLKFYASLSPEDMLSYITSGKYETDFNFMLT